MCRSLLIILEQSKLSNGKVCPIQNLHISKSLIKIDESIWNCRPLLRTHKSPIENNVFFSFLSISTIRPIFFFYKDGDLWVGSCHHSNTRLWVKRIESIPCTSVQLCTFQAGEKESHRQGIHWRFSQVEDDILLQSHILFIYFYFVLKFIKFLYCLVIFIFDNAA